MEVEMNTTESSTPLDPEEEMKKDVIKYFGFQPRRDSASEARNALLVVAALVATVTFDKGTDVPGNILNRPAKIIFVVANTIAFSASMLIVDFLTRGFPFKRELRVALFTVGFAYGAGVANNIKGVMEFVLLLLASFTPLIMRLLPV